MRICYATVSFAMFAAMWGAHAQSVDQLRGQVPEDALVDELTRRRALERQSQQDGGATAQAQQNRTGVTSVYQPESAGALPDQPDSGSSDLFDESQADSDDTFAGTPAPAGRPISAARRRGDEALDKRSPRDAATNTGRQRASEAAGRTGLPTDADATGAIERTEALERLGAADAAGNRVEAIEQRDRVAEEDPYAPVGLRLGTFNLYSTLETGLNWTSNVNYSPIAESALQSETTLRLRAESDWAEHAARIEAYGTLREVIDGPKVDDNSAGLKSELRLDISNELRGLGTFDYEIRPESATSPVVIEGAVSRPIRQSIEATAGLQKDFGKLRLGATVGLERDDYGDADLENGGVLSQSDRNSTLASLKLRTGYEISPALTPFVELEIGRRKYDETIDSSGFERSTNRLGARAGVAVDLGEKLRGEFSAGWLEEDPDDARLDSISGATADASLTWSPQRGTDVNLFGSTTVEGTTTAGESGSLLYTSRLNVSRQIRANLTANALLGASWRDYVGSSQHDLTLSAEAGMTWWMNRTVGITGRARHEQLRSNLEGRDTTTDSVFLGLKLQR